MSRPFGRTVTAQSSFFNMPNLNRDLFRVGVGVAASDATSVAEVLESAVRSQLQNAVGDGSMDANLAYLCGFALDAAGALRASIGDET